MHWSPVQIDEGDARVRRCTPVKCLSQEDVDERTIYVVRFYSDLCMSPIMYVSYYMHDACAGRY